MKKYTIKDNRGNKKIIYEENLDDSIRLNDVRLEKGDWFTRRRYTDVIYKVVVDQFMSHNGFSPSMIVEVYRIVYDFKLNKYAIKKVGTESFRPDELSNVVRFNSSKEAIDWLKRQLRLKDNKYPKRISKSNDSIYDGINEEFGDVRVSERNGKILIGWPSIGSVTIDRTERFMHDLQEAIDYAKKQM